MNITDYYPFFLRVAEWNSLRYDRVYSKELTVLLLKEEHQEFVDAKDLVEQVDALGDLTYVAFGALWKMGLPDQDIRDAAEYAKSAVSMIFNPNHQNEKGLWCVILPPEELIPAVVNCLLTGSRHPAVCCWLVILLCAITMTNMGLDVPKQLSALRAIADSNATKFVQHTSPTEKANGTDKGDSYVPPTLELKRILKELM